MLLEFLMDIIVIKETKELTSKGTNWYNIQTFRG